MPIVASRTLVAIDPGRGQFSIRLEIGQPSRCAADDWACSVALEGLYEHLWDQHGADSFQALMVAQNLARSLLGAFVRGGGRLVSPDGRAIIVEHLFSAG